MAEKLAKQFSATEITTNDYFPNIDYDPQDRKWIYDRSNAGIDWLDLKLLIDNINSLLAGKETEIPIRYQEKVDDDKKNYYKKKRKMILKKPEKSGILIVEGGQALQHKELCDMADLKIYVDSNPDLRLLWRIKRSPWYKRLEGKEPKRERDFGKSLDEAFDLWITSFKPKEEKYIIPSKKNADLVLLNSTWEDFDNNAEQVKNLIDSYLQNPQEFQKALAEERTKNQLKTSEPEIITKEIQVPASEKSIWKQPHVYLAFGIGFLLAGIIFWTFLNIKKRKNK